MTEIIFKFNSRTFQLSTLKSKVSPKKLLTPMTCKAFFLLALDTMAFDILLRVRWSPVSELPRDVDSSLEAGRPGKLSLQRLWPLLQAERHQQT